MAYFFYLKNKELVIAERQSDFPEALENIPPEDIEYAIEGRMVNFRVQEVPVVSKPEPVRKRRKSSE